MSRLIATHSHPSSSGTQADTLVEMLRGCWQVIRRGWREASADQQPVLSADEPDRPPGQRGAVKADAVPPGVAPPSDRVDAGPPDCLATQ